MEFLVKGIAPRTAQLGSRLILDAAIFSPTSLAGYMALRGALEGKSVGQVGEKFEEMYYDTLKVAWSVWPVLNVINFSFVPFHLRVLYNNTLCIGWSAYLSGAHDSRSEDSVLDDPARAAVAVA